MCERGKKRGLGNMECLDYGQLTCGLGCLIMVIDIQIWA